MPNKKNTMPDEMRKIHNDFYGNLDRLKGEWELCNSQYKEAMSTLKNEGAVFDDRLAIRKITDYWIRRRQALERTLPSEILAKIKK